MTLRCAVHRGAVNAELSIELAGGGVIVAIVTNGSIDAPGVSSRHINTIATGP